MMDESIPARTAYRGISSRRLPYGVPHAVFYGAIVGYGIEAIGP